MCRRSAFFSSSTEAFCTTTTAAGGESRVRPAAPGPRPARPARPLTHARSRRPPCTPAPSWPARTPGPPASRSPPPSPAGERHGCERSPAQPSQPHRPGPAPCPGRTCGGRSQSSGSCTSRASAAWNSSSTSAWASSSAGSSAGSSAAIAGRGGRRGGTGDAALLPGLRERAGGRGGAALPPLRLHHLSLRAQCHAEGDEQEVPAAEGGGRCAGRRRGLGERGFHGRAVPQVRAPPRLLHADPDALGRRAHDHLLQVLQPAVRAPLAGLRGNGITVIAAPAINAALRASCGSAWLFGPGREGKQAPAGVIKSCPAHQNTCAENTDRPEGNRAEAR